MSFIIMVVLGIDHKEARLPKWERQLSALFVLLYIEGPKGHTGSVCNL